MTLAQLAMAFLCMLMISFGQIMFKITSSILVSVGTWWHPRVALAVCAAGVIYILATLLWINLLREVDLSKAYPVMSMSFIVVPLVSVWIFGERLSPFFIMGMILVLGGLYLVFRYGASAN